MCNLYLVRVHHPELYGVDLDVVADDPEEAATMALAECPPDTYLERIYPCRVDVPDEDGVVGADGTPALMTARILSRERMERPAAVEKREPYQG
jgi:hypothetical protein